MCVRYFPTWHPQTTHEFLARKLTMHITAKKTFWIYTLNLRYICPLPKILMNCNVISTVIPCYSVLKRYKPLYSCDYFNRSLYDTTKFHVICEYRTWQYWDFCLCWYYCITVYHAFLSYLLEPEVGLNKSLNKYLFRFSLSNIYFTYHWLFIWNTMYMDITSSFPLMQFSFTQW